MFFNSYAVKGTWSMLWDFVIYLQHMFWVLCYCVCVCVRCMSMLVCLFRFVQIRSFTCLCEACMCIGLCAIVWTCLEVIYVCLEYTTCIYVQSSYLSVCVCFYTWVCVYTLACESFCNIYTYTILCKLWTDTFIKFESAYRHCHCYLCTHKFRCNSGSNKCVFMFDVSI